MDRDSTTRTGAKDPWGKEGHLLNSGTLNPDQTWTLSQAFPSGGGVRRIAANWAAEWVRREQA